MNGPLATNNSYFDEVATDSVAVYRSVYCKYWCSPVTQDILLYLHFQCSVQFLCKTPLFKLESICPVQLPTQSSLPSTCHMYC
jgi:hypothetical protein